MHPDATDKPDGFHAPAAAAHRAVTPEIDKMPAPGTAQARTTHLLTAAQLAQRWQVPVRTVYAWAKRNTIPHYRAGQPLRFDPIEVAEHFRRQGFADDIAANPERPGESAFALLTASHL